MRYLGLDLGTRTLGISISDTTGLIASSYKTLNFRENDYESLIEPLSEIINEFNVSEVVLGLPKNMDNSLGFAADRSLNFKALLESKLGLIVHLEDERLTSVEADKIMLEADISRNKRKKKIDALAATIILQSYLDSRR